jgi:hypothetical protein
MHAYALAEEGHIDMLLIKLLLNTGLYRTENAHRWVLPVINGKPEAESARYHMGFKHPSANLSQMPKKGQQCSLGAYKGNLAARYRVAGELLSLPPEARKILKSIDNADLMVTEAFDCSARLYQVAAVCERYFPSVGLAYRVAAVEAICQADPACKGFSDFMRKYISSQTDLDSILNYLYGVARSAHFHAGQFPMGEFSRHPLFDPLMDAEVVERYTLHRTCYELTREAIVNWLSRLIPDAVGINADESNQ